MERNDLLVDRLKKLLLMKNKMVQKLTEGMQKRVSFDVTFINMPNYNIVSKLQARSYRDITFIIFCI